MPSESGQGRNWHTGRVLGLRIPRGQIGQPALWHNGGHHLGTVYRVGSFDRPHPAAVSCCSCRAENVGRPADFPGASQAACHGRGGGGVWRRRRGGRGPLAAAGAPAAAAVESPSREAWPGMRLASSRARGSPVLVLAGAYSLASELEETGQTAARPHTTQ